MNIPDDQSVKERIVFGEHGCMLVCVDPAFIYIK